MTAFQRKLPLALLVFVLLASLVTLPTASYAQFYDESLESDELFPESGEDYFEPSQDEFGAPRERDFTEGDEYVDESTLPPSQQGVTPTGRQLQLNLQEDRQTLPLNAGWGAGTGLLIGGWFALINQGDNRTTQRSIGLGIVLGTILGAVVGVRSVINPDTPRAADASSPPRRSGSGDSPFSPVVALTGESPQVGFKLAF